MKGLLYLVVTLSACATASPQNSPDSGGGMVGRPDGGMMKDGSIVPQPDAAPLPDAPMGQTQVTLSATNDMTVAGGKGVACTESDPIFGFYLGTSDNQWYRVFKLSDYGITGAFNVQRVTFWIDEATAGSGTTQPATLKLGTYSGTVEQDTLTPASITNITTMPISISNASAGANVATNIAAAIPAGSNLVVELDVPNGANAGNTFFIGVSAGGETKKGYLSSAGCSMTTPKSLTSATGLNHPDNSILLTVTGTK